MKFSSSWSIRKKLLLLILVAVIPALGIILFSGLEQRKHQIASTKQDILHLVQSLAAQQELFGAGTRQMLQTLAELPEVQKIDAKACNRIFKDINEQNPIYSTISAATPDGNMFAASAPFTPGSVNLADRKHIRDAIRTRDFSAGEYIVGKLSRVPSINFTYPVLDKNGNLIAIVIAGLKLDQYKKFMAQVNLPEGSVMGMTDSNYLILYRFPEILDVPPGAPIPAKLLQGIPVDSKEGFAEVIGMDNVSRIYAYKRLRLRDNEPWYLGIYVGVDKNSVLHPANMALVYNLVFLGIACLFAMLLAWIAGNSIIVAPLNKLVIATQRFGEGEIYVRADLPHGEDEMGRLARSFDKMTVMLGTKDLERRKAEDALRESEGKYRSLIENIQDGIYILDSFGKFTFVNDVIVKRSGFPAEWFLCRSYLDVIIKEDHERVQKYFNALMDGKTQIYDLTYPDKSGNLLHVEVCTAPLFDNAKVVGTLGISRDITERKKAEEALHASLREKDILLSEIHHRVKNNLQVISSLLKLQARASQNPEVIKGFNDSQDRIRAMAIVHEKLYNSKDFTRIDLAGYVRSLSEELFQSYNINSGKIYLIIQADAEVYVDIIKAIPCGLIMNELISNALKHAFQGDGPGKLQIIIGEMKDREIEIVVRNNGVSLPDDVDIHRPQSVGLHLVNGLVKNQLDGQMEVRRDNGTEFRITFPL